MNSKKSNYSLLVWLIMAVIVGNSVFGVNLTFAQEETPLPTPTVSPTIEPTPEAVTPTPLPTFPSSPPADGNLFNLEIAPISVKKSTLYREGFSILVTPTQPRMTIAVILKNGNRAMFNTLTKIFSGSGMFTVKVIKKKVTSLRKSVRKLNLEIIGLTPYGYSQTKTYQIRLK